MHPSNLFTHAQSKATPSPAWRRRVPKGLLQVWVTGGLAVAIFFCPVSVALGLDACEEVAGNLVSNCGFEDSSSLPDDTWPTITGTGSVEMNPPCDGGGSKYAEITPAVVGPGSYNATLESACITGVAEDTEYEVQATFRAGSTVPGTCYLTVYFYTDDCASQIDYLQVNVTPRSNTCEFPTGSHTSPAGTGSARIRLDCSKNDGNFSPVLYDSFSLAPKPTLVELVSFTAEGFPGLVTIKWETASEMDTVGFNVLRSGTDDGIYNQINSPLIPAKGSSTQGASYEFVDDTVESGKTYYYKLEDLDASGGRSFYGPVSATVPAAIPAMTEMGLIVFGAAFLITSAILLRRGRREPQINPRL